MYVFVSAVQLSIEKIDRGLNEKTLGRVERRCIVCLVFVWVKVNDVQRWTRLLWLRVIRLRRLIVDGIEWRFIGEGIEITYATVKDTDGISSSIKPGTGM